MKAMDSKPLKHTDKANVSPVSQFVLKSRPICIYVVEDDLFDQRLIQISLEKQVFSSQLSIQFFSSGEQLIKYFTRSAQRPDILICDINLPGLSGCETIKVLLNDGVICPQTSIFVLSGSDQVHDSSFTENLEVDRYLQKPANINAWSYLANLIWRVWQENEKESL